MDIFFCILNKLSLSLLNCMIRNRTCSSRFSTNSEAKASELVENLEEMFLHYW